MWFKIDVTVKSLKSVALLSLQRALGRPTFLRALVGDGWVISSKTITLMCEVGGSHLTLINTLKWYNCSDGGIQCHHLTQALDRLHHWRGSKYTSHHHIKGNKGNLGLCLFESLFAEVFRLQNLILRMTSLLKSSVWRNLIYLANSRASLLEPHVCETRQVTKCNAAQCDAIGRHWKC